MKKKIATYKFKNNKKEIAVYYVENEKNYPNCDCISLEFKKNGRLISGVGLRPDEAILIIKLLSEAVFKTVKNYEIELLTT